MREKCVKNARYRINGLASLCHDPDVKAYIWMHLQSDGKFVMDAAADSGFNDPRRQRQAQKRRNLSSTTEFEPPISRPQAASRNLSSGKGGAASMGENGGNVFGDGHFVDGVQSDSEGGSTDCCSDDNRDECGSGVGRVDVPAPAQWTLRFSSFCLYGTPAIRHAFASELECAQHSAQGEAGVPRSRPVRLHVRAAGGHLQAYDVKLVVYSTSCWRRPPPSRRTRCWAWWVAMCCHAGRPMRPCPLGISTAGRR